VNFGSSGCHGLRSGSGRATVSEANGCC